MSKEAFVEEIAARYGQVEELVGCWSFRTKLEVLSYKVCIVEDKGFAQELGRFIPQPEFEEELHA